ncbi:hypothetical protein OLZ31_26035 [Enterobacter asburiae]|nr:hypothetical protein [Enterobacter asburiae]
MTIKVKGCMNVMTMAPGMLQHLCITYQPVDIMLNEFDQYLHKRYLSGKARKDRWYWNHSIQRGRSTDVRENWQWKWIPSKGSAPLC